MSRNFILFALLAGAFACAEAGDYAEGGIGGSGISQGPITEFGSIFVNGIEWFLDDAEIEFDGETVAIAGFNESQKTALFNLGMVVRVEGTIDSNGDHWAERVFFDDEIEGPVSDPGVPGQFRELTVLGQSILLEEGVTQFFDEDPVDGEPDFGFDTIARGDVVEISGLVEVVGDVEVVRATSVERKSKINLGVTEVELKGIVSELTASTFKLGIVNVTFDPEGVTTDFSDLPGGPDGLEDGTYVEVEGTLVEPDRIMATEIDLEDDFDDDDVDVDEFSTTGFVNGFTSPDETFFVGNQEVELKVDVEFEHGNASMLDNGRRVEVEGELIDGILEVEEIEFEDQEVRVYAAIAQAEDIDVEADSFTLLGIEIRVFPSTRFEDKTPDDVPDFGLDAISAGDFLEVRGQVDPQGVITAFRVERDDSDPIRLYGNLESFNEAETGELVILGVTVPTSGADFKIDADPDPLKVDKECFFSNLEEGDFVEVKGDDDSDTELVLVKDVKLVKEGATSCD